MKAKFETEGDKAMATVNKAQAQMNSVHATETVVARLLETADRFPAMFGEAGDVDEYQPDLLDALHWALGGLRDAIYALPASVHKKNLYARLDESQARSDALQARIDKAFGF
jgi:hypothetical protein